MVLFNIRNYYILRPKLPKTPIFLAKILLYSSYILGKTWLTACKRSPLSNPINKHLFKLYYNVPLSPGCDGEFQWLGAALPPQPARQTDGPGGRLIHRQGCPRAPCEAVRPRTRALAPQPSHADSGKVAHEHRVRQYDQEHERWHHNLLMQTQVRLPTSTVWGSMTKNTSTGTTTFSCRLR